MRIILLLLFFISGGVSLVYEVLWFAELAYLFGSTEYAVATTLTVFFLGLSIGGYFWGKSLTKFKNPLRVYALLELAIGFSAVFYFFISDVYFLIYPVFFSLFGQNFPLLTLIKFLLSITLLFPASFFIGGTFPVIGQVLIREKEQFGKMVSLLYSVNTAGAVVGVLAAGFFLPPLLGFSKSYYLAISLNFAIFLTAFYLSYYFMPGYKIVESRVPERGFLEKIDRMHLLIFFFFSGFITLGLEVLWTKMFVQVFRSDVYSFSAILIIFLIALSAGGFAARGLVNLSYNPQKVLAFLLILAGAGVGLSTFFFYNWTAGLSFHFLSFSWGKYLANLFLIAGGIMLIPTILAGCIFPYLLYLAFGNRQNPSETIGVWTALNTFGGILGTLFSGFFLISFFGLWKGIGILSALYFLISLFISQNLIQKNFAWRGVVTIFLILIFSFLPSFYLPTSKLNLQNQEILKEVFPARGGVVSVISSRSPQKEDGDLLIRLNNHYTLGGLSSLPEERRQAHLALFLHPNPKSVFFLGLGTGITAGAALFHPVEKVTVAELVPQVVFAAKKYFEPYTNGLFSQKKVNIIVEDGRNFLFGTSEKYDVIIGDLLNPSDQGTGNLYSLEHFQQVKAHLKDGGIFVQWLPLYQLSDQGFGIIARTMTEVFPQVTLWRGNFLPETPIVALIGEKQTSKLDGKNLVEKVNHLGQSQDGQEALVDLLINVKGVAPKLSQQEKDFLAKIMPQMIKAAPFTFYAGNLGQVKEMFWSYPLNTDDKPIFEFVAPKVLESQGKLAFFRGKELENFLSKLIEKLPPEKDPYLQRLSKEELNYVEAGLSYYQYFVSLENADLIGESQILFEDYLKKIGLLKILPKTNEKKL